MEGKKRILVIGPGMQIGGVERSLIGLLNSFDYETVDVDLYLFSHTGEFMPMINSNVRLIEENKLLSHISQPILSLVKQGHILSAFIRLLSKCVAAIRSAVTKQGTVNTALCNRLFTAMSHKLPTEYDLALGFFGPHFFLEKKVKAKTKIGWVHTDYTNSAECLDKKFFFSSWAGLDYIACVSDSVKTSFAMLYPQLEEKMIVLENIIDPDFVRAHAQAFDVHEEMPEDGSFRLLSVGRFCYAKGFDDAIRACKRLRDEGLPVKWYFIGYGPDQEMLRSLVKELCVEEYAIILGKKVNPYPYIYACDLYVQPSRYEGKAVTVREAQILAKPVIITDFQTARSQLADGVDGHICPMGVEGIVTGISFMMKDPEFLKTLRYNTMRSDYSNKDVARLILERIKN